MTTISANLQAVRTRIAAACANAGRPVGEVRLLAVSKTWPASFVREAAACGQRDFGENFVREGVEKMAALADLELCWHFIGPLQSNKTRLVAEHFAWVHSIDRERIAERLSEQRPPHLPPLDICLQVNVSGEESKGGVAPQAAAALARTVRQLPRLRLRGLMAIPEPSADGDLLRRRFATLRNLRDDLNGEGFGFDSLSMGMSGDFETAIREGATVVRLGTLIFGTRVKESPT